MSKAEEANCANCRFWLRIDGAKGGPSWGMCRRYPPTEEAEDNGWGQRTNTFPLTEDDIWCGEHRAALAKAGITEEGK